METKLAKALAKNSSTFPKKPYKTEFVCDCCKLDRRDHDDAGCVYVGPDEYLRVCKYCYEDGKNTSKVLT